MGRVLGFVARIVGIFSVHSRFWIRLFRGIVYWYDSCLVLFGAFSCDGGEGVLPVEDRYRVP